MSIGLGHVVVGPGVEAALALARHHLAGDGDDGEVLEPVDGTDGADGLVAVHDRHHDVHEHDVEIRRLLKHGQGFGAALGHEDLGAALVRAER